MKYLLLLSFIGCANYVDSMHRQIDREEGNSRANSAPHDPYKMYRDQGFRKTKQDARPVNSPKTMSESAIPRSSHGDILPTVQRNYKPQNYRYNSKDFVDNDNSGSLWGSNTLYGAESAKRPGDIVIINVLDNLRTQISSELKRAFPDTGKKSTPKADGTAPASAAASGGAAPAGAAADQELDTKVYDKISSLVTEEISDEYVLVKGKKEVIFRKEKRFIEIQALVSRRDIQDNDTVNSDKVLESRVFILR
jgi:flagellar L-ring protein FlgH